MTLVWAQVLLRTGRRSTLPLSWQANERVYDGMVAKQAMPEEAIVSRSADLREAGHGDRAAVFALRGETRPIPRSERNSAALAQASWSFAEATDLEGALSTQLRRPRPLAATSAKRRLQSLPARLSRSKFAASRLRKNSVDYGQSRKCGPSCGTIKAIDLLNT